MTEPSDDAIEERLRAILRAEAGSVDPSPEALSAIRTRTQRGSGWFAAVLNASWLRPSLAVGAAALIAGSVLLGTPQVREQILPQSLTTPTEKNEAPPGHGGGAPGQDEDDTSGKTTPEPGPADRPSGGAPPPQGDPAEPEETEEGSEPFGTTGHCVGGTPVPAPSGSPNTAGATPHAEQGSPTTECEPTDEPTTPPEDPPDEVPGDGSSGDSTPPPGDGGGDSGGDTGAPTTGPGNNSSGSTGDGAAALKTD